MPLAGLTRLAPGPLQAAGALIQGEGARLPSRIDIEVGRENARVVAQYLFSGKDSCVPRVFTCEVAGLENSCKTAV
jgi:hypothetical protein